jgi:hypothetical protein
MFATFRGSFVRAMRFVLALMVDFYMCFEARDSSDPHFYFEPQNSEGGANTTY